MKRLLLFLLVALMLSGCAKQPPVETTASTPPSTDAALELYVQDSLAQQQTGGAVRTYALTADTYFDLYSMGANLLVVGQSGLLVLAGEQGEVVATWDTDEMTPTTVLDTAVTGMAYYQATTRQVIVRNPMLKGSTQVQLPENIVGTPVISLDKNEVYYSIGNEIRAMNIATGISRLIWQQSVATQTLLGAYFDGSVLLRKFADGAEAPRLEYISSETGQILGENTGVSQLYTHGAKYVAYWQDGAVYQTAFGSRGETAGRFLVPRPEETTGGQVPVPAQNGMVNYDLIDGNLNLSFYDLQSGKRTAQVSFSQEKLPTKVCSDGTYIWILSADKLYRWDIAKSPVQDETTYTGPLYTAQQPDTEGLAQCQSMVDAMSTQYGVKLLIWQNATEKTGGYTVIAEHEPQTITAMLEKLQPMLAHFPETFLQKTVEMGWIRIALVRSIDGYDQCVQFWEDGDCWILMPAQAEAASVIEKMAYAIISHVRGNSRDLDEDRWNPLNPEGFAYTGNNVALEKPEYLEGENRAFTDRLAMSYPHEDQSRMFYYAMLADNGEMFQSPIMQAKLQRLCMGIREAYNLQKNTNTFVWEQYLQTSLAYVK